MFSSPKQWLRCTEPEQAERFLAETDELQKQGLFLAGWIGYEFGYLLEPSLLALCPPQEEYALLGVFEQPLIIDHQAGDRAALETFLSNRRVEGNSEKSFKIEDLKTSIKHDDYLEAIKRIKEYIVAGDTYQVNYTLKLLFNFSGSPAGIYSSLRRNQEVSYGAWIRQCGRDVMSFSPELFFRADKDRITVRPMKGTMKRGRNLVEDVQQRAALQGDVKNRSENVMIVDLLRNDLGRLLHLTGGGKVKPRSLFDVEVYETVLQMTSTVDGIPARGSLPGLSSMLPALFPCGSVTGAPKIRTMEIIHELERHPRGVYCGAIGFSGPGESIFNVPIRTVVLNGNQGEMGIGSGIVFDSDPESEWQESLLKARFLTDSEPDFQLIETLLWQPGSGYWLFEEHMERLTDSAAYFLFRWDREEVTGLLNNKASGFLSPMRVRLLLHRDGSIDISAKELEKKIEMIVSHSSSSALLPKVVFSEYCVDPDNIHLYHKTTKRRLYVEERKKGQAEGAYEVLFCNSREEVTEGTISNVFIEKDGKLLTPPIECGLLAGTFRRHLIEQGTASEQVLTREDVRQAAAVYVGNSVRGLVQVELTGD